MWKYNEYYLCKNETLGFFILKTMSKFYFCHLTSLLFFLIDETLIQHAICALHTTGFNVLFEAVTKVRAKQLKTSSSVSVCVLHLFSSLLRGTNQKIFSDALTTISKLNYIIQLLYTYNINFPSIPAHCCVDAVFPLAARAAVTAWAKQCK